MLLHRPVNSLGRPIYILTAAKEGQHCQPSSTSFGLVDRFMGNYSATGRANSSSGRGESITPLDNYAQQPSKFVSQEWGP